MSDSDPQQRSKNAQTNIGKGMFIIGWVIVLGLLTTVFGSWQNQQVNPNQTVQSRLNNGASEVVLQRNKWGHYVTSGFINGIAVTFILDTGATLVTVPDRVAKLAGLTKGHRSRSSTANGTIEVFMSEIKTLKIGNIGMNNVKASINPHMDGREILLGMSFLKHLEIIQRDGTLTLRQ